MPKKQTQADAIRAFKKKFGDRYDYSKVHYVNNTTKVVVICHRKDPITHQEHGEFLITPKNHKKGRGCPLCAKNHPMDTAEFVRKAKDKYGDLYDYSQAHYVKSNIKVTIICPKHGAFSMTPNEHLRGHGCPQCGLVLNHTDEANKKRAKNGAATNMRRYGVSNSMQRPEVMAKHQANLQNALLPGESMLHCLNRLFGEGAFAEDELAVLKKHWYMLEGQKLDAFMRMVNFFRRKHVFVPLQVDESKRKQQLTNVSRYGTNNWAKSKEHKDRVPEINRKMHDTKMKNHTFATSKMEDQVYDVLVRHFGKDDIVQQYHNDDTYPFDCDFYIKSRDLYLEINTMPFHDDHWFDINSTRDRNKALKLRQSLSKWDNGWYKTWTQNDVCRRECAHKHNLNYVVLWDKDLDNPFDLEMWADLGFPDGRDWDHEYSWFPDLSQISPMNPPKSLRGSTTVSELAKYYQFDNFYKNEIALYNQDVDSIRHFLFKNRLQYAKKLPTELTQYNLMYAFKISGKHYGYSSFNIKPMKKFIDDYRIHSVLDPCAGWGERMICSYMNDVVYYGYDINSNLEQGYRKMISDYKMDKQFIAFGDSAKAYFPHGLDAVFTCPPYFDKEIYTNEGAENYTHNDFLQWWYTIAKKAYETDISFFAFQVDRAHKDEMCECVEQAGYRFVEEYSLTKKSSPLNRKDGKIEKHEYETLLVFQRI